MVDYMIPSLVTTATNVPCHLFPQTHMTEYEQKLLEKELLLEQVSRLAHRTQVLCQQRKAATQQIGSKVNSYQAKLRETSRKMMALVAELSVQQVSLVLSK